MGLEVQLLLYFLAAMAVGNAVLRPQHCGRIYASLSFWLLAGAVLPPACKQKNCC